MKFLVIEQDLRVSGTSQGIISRSFLSKLRVSYPDSIIDVVYIKTSHSDDQLHLLPVDNIETHVLNLNTTFFTKWLNKIYWRFCHITLIELNTHKKFRSIIEKIDYKKYDHIFIRSSGLDHETILASEGLPILKRAIVNFHDPYPLFWYSGSKWKLSNLDLFRMKKMHNVVMQSKKCMSSAKKMSQDMQFLYGSEKKFFTLPHQYDENVFNFSDISKIYKKNKKVTLSYHGAIQFGRNVDNLLDAYLNLIHKHVSFQQDTEFVLRLRGSDFIRLKEKYQDCKNILILNTLDFSNSSYEQIHESDINIILENGPLYCNILVGKAPFLDAIKKPVFIISPEVSELREIVTNNNCIANMNDIEEIQTKLEKIIENRLISSEDVYSFGNYFSNENFKVLLDKVLSEK